MTKTASATSIRAGRRLTDPARMNSAATGAWTFEPDPASTPEARRRVWGVLEGSALESAVDTVAVVVSELATNAVLHAGTPFEVRVLVLAHVIRVEVHDDTCRMPTLRTFNGEASSGRGLQLVDGLSEAWGVDTDGDGRGKTVWAEVPIADAPTSVLDFDLSSVEDW